MIKPPNMKHVGNTPFDARLDAIGLEAVGRAHWNLPPAKLILQTLLRGEGVLSSSGALAIATGTFTGRSPKDRFLVRNEHTESRCLLYTSPSPRDKRQSRMPSSA